MIGATTRLVEDITTFNKDYTGDLKIKNEAARKVFDRIEKYRIVFQETLSKFDFTSQSSLSPESLSTMVSFVESRFKSECAPIIDSVLRLPTNDLRSINESQGGEIMI